MYAFLLQLDTKIGSTNMNKKVFLILGMMNKIASLFSMHRDEPTGLL